MRVLTITCHAAQNHGAMLQAAALIAHLRGLGHEAASIGYRCNWHNKYSWHNLFATDQRYSRYGLGWAYALVKAPIRWHNRHVGSKRREAFERFANQYIPTTPERYTSIDELQANPPEADVYLAGSDQIWNTTLDNGLDPAFYLDFGQARRLSYAASFGIDPLEPGTEPLIRRQLARFDAISVRESSAVRILKELGYEGEQVVDPVFLHDADYWRNLGSHAGEGERYLLLYHFDRKGEIIDLAARMARLYDLPIYSFYPCSVADKSLFDCGPADFVSLVANAMVVVSNSFHATAFSMIFGKDFWVVNRTDGLNARMRDLMARYGLQSRLATMDTSDSDLLAPIDYTHMRDLLAADIYRSKQWLYTQLNL